MCGGGGVGGPPPHSMIRCQADPLHFFQDGIRKVDGMMPRDKFQEKENESMRVEDQESDAVPETDAT